MHSRLVRTIAGVALLLVPLSACGGGSSTSSSSVSGADVTVHAQDSLKFDKTDYSAKSGDIKIAYVGTGSLTHTLLIKDKSGFKLQISGHETQDGTVNLTPGSYTLYCDIPGHEQAGMKATLTVS